MSKHPNEQQLKAIKHVDGVMRVLAGPGTGKTEVLGQRIANLLQSDAQIAPNEILCITFTDAGRIAMRDRLTKIMGSDTAQKVNIHTYHSFCNEIIQQNKAYFRREDLEQISGLEELELIYQLIDSLPVTHLFKQTKQPYYIAKNLLNFFNNIKSENLDSNELMLSLERYIEVEMPIEEKFIYKKAYKGKKAGDFKPDYYTYLEKLDKTKEAIKLFNKYAALMIEAGRYDYNDMILWVIDMLEKNEAVLQSYWERYQYILVDEYQDTNGAQNKLIQLLTSYSNDPNLFVVGDDDQSIYKFQGANAENMCSLEVLNNGNLRPVTLTQNYRSQQEILNTAHHLISVNTTRLKDKNELLEGKTQNALIPPSLAIVDTLKHDFANVALQVRHLIQNKNVEPKQIAIIFRKNKMCLQMTKYLRHIDIPFFTETEQDLLKMPFVQQILNILSYVNAENLQYGSGDAYLFKILHAPFFKIPAIQIGKANYMASSMREPYCTLREYLSLHYVNADFSDDKLLAVNTLLESFIGNANNYPLYLLFREIVEKCKLHAYILQQTNSLELLDQLTALFNWLEQETESIKGLTLEQLIQNIEIMQMNSEELKYTTVIGSRNGVQVLTVYKSKGLEYEYVFIPACTKQKWDMMSNRNGFTLPQSITNKFSSTHSDDESKNDELRRLMFVAITRAKKQVFVSYNTYNDKGKEESMSQLVPQIFSNKIIEEASQQEIIGTADLALFEPIDLISDKLLLLAQSKEDFIQRQVDNFTMNATALNNYLDCPLRFYFNNILRMPSGINENSNFGTAIHDALETYFRDMQANQQIFGTLELLLSTFEKMMARHRRNFTKQGFVQKLEYGKQILELNYNTYKNSWERNVEVEWKPKVKVLYKGIPLTAKVDKLEFLQDKDVAIVDYKTGDVEGDYAKINLSKPYEKNPLGGGYWRQAVFYKLFVEIAEPTWRFVSAQFVYVEPSKKDKKLHIKKVVIAPEDEQAVMQQIEETWQNIHAHNFYSGCNKEECSYCNFVKENKLEL